MNKILLVLAQAWIICIGFNLPLFGQNNYLNQNYDFLINNGNDYQFLGSPPSCYTFKTLTVNGVESIPGWEISHGVPHLDKPTDVSCMLVAFDPTVKLGDGLLAKCDFIKNEKYVVTVELCDYPDIVNKLQGGSLKFILPPLNVMPFNRSLTSCGDVIPTVSGQQLVGTISSANISPPPNPLVFQFQFTASHKSKFLWIMPDGSTDYVQAYIKYVKIQQRCNELLTYTNVLSPDVYSHFQYINSGSSYNGYSPLITTINNTTVFQALQNIELKDIFLAQPSDGQYFLAEIRPGMCDIEILPEHKHSGNELQENLLTEDNNTYHFGPSKSDNTSALSVSPNPSNGVFTLKLNGDNGKITVLNAIGTVVYHDQFSNEREKVIHLNERLPAGNYIIQIKGKDINQTERISIIR